MRARRTENTDHVHTLQGGTEDNDLWAYYVEDNNKNIYVATVWEPTRDERKRIAEGENILLLVMGEKTPPVAMDLTDEKLGKAKDDPPQGMENNSA